MKLYRWIKEWLSYIKTLPITLPPKEVTHETQKEQANERREKSEGIR